MTVTNYTRELADIICSRMTEGESLRAICRTPGFPSEGTVRGWAVRNHDNFGERYRAARALLVEFWADQILDGESTALGWNMAGRKVEQGTLSALARRAALKNRPAFGTG